MTDQQGTEGPETRFTWEYRRDGRDFVQLVNTGQDPALAVEVRWSVQRDGEDLPAETRKADLVPPGYSVAHNRTPMPQGTEPSVPRQVLWEVSWDHPHGGRFTERIYEPVDF